MIQAASFLKQAPETGLKGAKAVPLDIRLC